MPYLNGGIFDLHELEKKHADIKIPDEAFERIFAFFNEFQWHLDDRPLANDKEINPDVLGYIFEKYINQKQMGAYYTKEDITGYIARNTIVPFLLDAAARACPDAFRPDGPVWRLLREEPDKYIFEPVRHGVDRPLPPEIAAGLDNVAERKDWNRLAPIGFALLTETWREHVARRQRCLDIRQKLTAGEIHTANDLITYNLDVCQFAEDVLDTCDDPKLLHAFWQALEKVSILDPTCGSGAFLFAALNILQLLYDACLDRMEACLDDAGGTGGAASAQLADFRNILDQLERHPSRNYFIFKSIIVQNLYGVDIMREAVEICKLRLFLKLVSQVQLVEQLEPLPDIDFNIRAGNTLVGFATLAEVEKTLQGTLGFTRDEFEEIVAAAKRADEEFRLFRQLQTEFGKGAVDFSEVKGRLRTHLDALRFRLDYYLAGEYGKDTTSPTEVGPWILSHQPFHWFAEFYGTMNRGGFDVIIGNPPYVEYRRSKVDYVVTGFATADCKNLYAFAVERSFNLLREEGRVGLIIPLASISIDDTHSLRTFLLQEAGLLLHASFGFRPAKLFEGVNLRLTVLLAGKKGSSRAAVWSSGYLLWCQEERPHLFCKVSPLRVEQTDVLGRLPKPVASLGISILSKVLSNTELLGSLVSKTGNAVLHYHRSPLYWIRAMDFEPYFQSATKTRSVHHLRDVYLRDSQATGFVGCVLNSSLFYWWFVNVGNCRNLTGEDVRGIPIGRPSAATLSKSNTLFQQLMNDYRQNSKTTIRYNCEYQTFFPVSQNQSSISSIRCWPNTTALPPRKWISSSTTKSSIA